MSTSKEYMQFVLDQLEGFPDVTYRKMFGEYMVYLQGRPVLLVCDNCAMVKKLPELAELMRGAPDGLPYEGAGVHSVLDLEDRELVRQVMDILLHVTPLPKRRIQVNDYVDGAVLREIPTGFSCPELDGKYFLVTGTGKYFKNVQYAPEINLGLVRLTDGGETAQLLWGFADGGKFTSEFPAHMMSHAERLKVDPQNRVVMHCHPANLLAMTYVHSLDEKAFTRTLWQMCTECIVVFPDGVNVLPWMLCGTNEIGEATAEKMRTARLVVWAQHGIYGTGKDLDETFGLIETAEKAAEIYMKIAHLPLVNTITDDQMHQLEAHFGVKAREGYLS